MRLWPKINCGWVSKTNKNKVKKMEMGAHTPKKTPQTELGVGVKCNPLEGIYISPADTRYPGHASRSRDEDDPSASPAPTILTIHVAGKCINQFHVFLSARPSRFECLVGQSGCSGVQRVEIPLPVPPP